MFLELFRDTPNTDNHFTPKFHFMLHYGTIVKLIGPLKKTMVFRFEQKHQELKQYAKACYSRINLPLSLCRKFCLDAANTFLEKGNIFLMVKEIILKPESNIKGAYSCEVSKPMKSIKAVSYVLGDIIYYEEETFRIDEIVQECGKEDVLLYSKKLICHFTESLGLFLIIEEMESFQIIRTSDLQYAPVNSHNVNQSLFLFQNKTFLISCYFRIKLSCTLLLFCFQIQIKKLCFLGKMLKLYLDKKSGWVVKTVDVGLSSRTWPKSTYFPVLWLVDDPSLHVGGSLESHILGVGMLWFTKLKAFDMSIVLPLWISGVVFCQSLRPCWIWFRILWTYDVLHLFSFPVYPTSFFPRHLYMDWSKRIFMIPIPESIVDNNENWWRSWIRYKHQPLVWKSREKSIRIPDYFRLRIVFYRYLISTSCSQNAFCHTYVCEDLCSLFWDIIS